MRTFRMGIGSSLVGFASVSSSKFLIRTERVITSRSGIVSASDRVEKESLGRGANLPTSMRAWSLESSQSLSGCAAAVVSAILKAVGGGDDVRDLKNDGDEKETTITKMSGVRRRQLLWAAEARCEVSWDS